MYARVFNLPKTRASAYASELIYLGTESLWLAYHILCYPRCPNRVGSKMGTSAEDPLTFLGLELYFVSQSPENFLGIIIIILPSLSLSC